LPTPISTYGATFLREYHLIQAKRRRSRARVFPAQFEDRTGSDKVFHLVFRCCRFNQRAALDGDTFPAAHTDTALPIRIRSSAAT
jgi:hypothetical protein